jgi:hypothetical protein
MDTIKIKEVDIMLWLIVGVGGLMILDGISKLV